MTRDELIAAMQADGAEKPIPVEIPAWGALFVRLPSVEEADAREDEALAAGGKRGYARAAAMVICDENGKRLFDPANEQDIDLLSKRRFADLQQVLLAGRPSGN